MVKKLYYTVCLFVVLLATSCSESLEETYDEFAGDGMVHYVGKCTEVEVNPGWERLQVVWKHNIDPGVKKVKITWKSDATSGEMFADAHDPESENLMDTVYIENLADGMYTVRVSSVAIDGSESLVEEKYGRPYSYEHEDLRSFSRGVTAFSRMGDKLAVVLEQDNENVKEMLLCFKDKTGKTNKWDIKQHASDSLVYNYWGFDLKLGRDYLFLLPDEEGVEIDFDQPIVVKRKGKLLECIDTIDFIDEVLDLKERLWSTEFSQLMLAAYGPTWESMVNEVEELEMDYDMASMLDLMYFPKLKKVILGKNRYMNSKYAKESHSRTNEYESLVMLQFLKDSRPEFTVERYNNHYFYERNSFGVLLSDAYAEAKKLTLEIEEKGNNNMDAKPQFIPLDTVGWKMTCSDTLFNGYKTNGVANLLFDGTRHFVEEYWGQIYEWDEEVYFGPAETIGAKIITVTYDMKTARVVEGFKAGQPTRDEEGDTDYLLENLVVEFSTDGYTYTPCNYLDGNVTIGNTPGEESYLLVPEEMRKPVRYIRLRMTNRPIGTISNLTKYSLRLGKFIPCTVE